MPTVLKISEFVRVRFQYLQIHLFFPVFISNFSLSGQLLYTIHDIYITHIILRAPNTLAKPDRFSPAKEILAKIACLKLSEIAFDNENCHWNRKPLFS